MSLPIASVNDGPSPSVRIFGQMGLDFTAPAEFSLPPQLFMSGGSANGGDATAAGTTATSLDWLSNIPASLLFGGGGASAADSSAAAVPEDSALLQSIAPSSCWPVLNMPLSGKKVLSIELSSSSSTTAADASSAANTADTTTATAANSSAAKAPEGNYSVGSLLFQKLAADENRRRRRAAPPAASAAAASASASSDADVDTLKDASFLAFLRTGLDPNESIAVDVTPSQLLFGLGELQRRYAAAAAAAAAAASSSSPLPAAANQCTDVDNVVDTGGVGMSEAMRVATVSESFVRLLAWQRLGQIVREVDLSAAAPAATKRGREAAGADEQQQPSGKASRCEGVVAVAEGSASIAEEGSSVYGVSKDPSAANKVELFRTLAAIMQRGPHATSSSVNSNSNSGGSSSSSNGTGGVVSFTSRSTQCHLVTAGVNTTLPFADPSRISESEAAEAVSVAGGAAAVVGQKTVSIARCLLALPPPSSSSASGGLLPQSPSAAVADASPSSLRLSPVIIQIWNMRRGLLGATVIGGDDGTAGGTMDSSSVAVKDESEATGVAATSAARLLRVALPYGVTTIGRCVTDDVQIGVGELDDEIATAASASTPPADAADADEDELFDENGERSSLVNSDATLGTSSSAIAPRHLRIMVTPVSAAPAGAAAAAGSAVAESGADAEGQPAAAAPQKSFGVCVRVMSCGGGGSGLCVEGGRWAYGAAVTLLPGQTVRFGASLAMAFSLAKPRAPAAE